MQFSECVHTFSMDIELRNDRIPFDRQFLDMTRTCSLKVLFNYSAIIVGESSPLLSTLIEEDANYSSQIAKLV